jgi:hypothetical protein
MCASLAPERLAGLHLYSIFIAFIYHRPVSGEYEYCGSKNMEPFHGIQKHKTGISSKRAVRILIKFQSP